MSQQINLFNPIFRKQEKPFSARTVAFLLGAIAVGLATLSVFAFMQARGAERMAAESSRQLAVERERVLQFAGKSPQARSKALEAEVSRLDGEVKARQNVLAALATGELGNTTGFSEFMAAFGRQTMAGVWLTGVRIADAGSDLEVRGRALRPDLVPAYLRALNKEPAMRGRRVTEMKLVSRSVDAAKAAGPERFVEFTVTAPLHVAESAKGAAK